MTVPLLGAGKGAPGASAPATFKWNPSDKSAGITLSNSDLTAAQASGTTEGVRGTVALTGKKCFAFEVDAAGGRVGIAKAAHDLDATPLGGAGSNSIVINCANGNVFFNNGTLATYTTLVVNDVGLVAFDADNGDIWFGEGTTWNGDPGAGTGAVKSDVDAGPWYPVFGGPTTTTPGVTIVPFPTTPPTGFTAFDPAS